MYPLGSVNIKNCQIINRYLSDICLFIVRSEIGIYLKNIELIAITIRAILRRSVKLAVKIEKLSGGSCA